MVDATTENLGIVWSSIADLCATLTAVDWDRPTACPGWTVRDQLSHLVGPEAAFLGRPQPVPLDVPPPWVRNEIGAANEAAVAHRRDWHGADVLEEFREVTAERMEQLRALSEEELAESSWTPTGPGTYRDLLTIRAFDAWVHEQDIREVVGQPGHVEGPVAACALDRCFAAMPYVVGKKAAAAEGATVRFDVTGPTAGQLGIEVVGGRARAVDPPPAAPAVVVAADFLPFTRLACGRADAAAAFQDGTVVATGDPVLGEAVVHHLAFMI